MPAQTTISGSKGIQVRGFVTGVKELEQAFNTLGKTMTRSILLSALKTTAKPTVKAAKMLAPKITGEGAKSIKARRNKKLKPAGISIGPAREHFYMMFHEFGFHPGGGSRFVPPTPFLRPAWDVNKNKMLDDFEKIVWTKLSKKARTLAKKAEKGKLGKRTAAKLRGDR